MSFAVAVVNSVNADMAISVGDDISESMERLRAGRRNVQEGLRCLRPLTIHASTVC